MDNCTWFLYAWVLTKGAFGGFWWKPTVELVMFTLCLQSVVLVMIIAYHRIVIPSTVWNVFGCPWQPSLIPQGFKIQWHAC